MKLQSSPAIYGILFWWNCLAAVFAGIAAIAELLIVVGSNVEPD
jgi:hypothetical protein